MHRDSRRRWTQLSLEGKKLVFISILRAGNGLPEGMLDLVPSARVIMHRAVLIPRTIAVEYYFKVPDEPADRPIVVA
ncbi:MAG: hypothetical protein H6982_09750 [Chromatiales bacterium]|nr:hypothetical protein [Chromatiales bacterium]